MLLSLELLVLLVSSSSSSSSLFHHHHYHQLFSLSSLNFINRVSYSNETGPYPTKLSLCGFVSINKSSNDVGIKVSYVWWCSKVVPLLSDFWTTVYPKKYAHGFVVLCFVVVMQSFIMNSHEVFIHIHQGCFAGTGAIVRLPQCQLSKPDGYGKISQCITTTKHSKAKTVCIFIGMYCTWHRCSMLRFCSHSKL